MTMFGANDTLSRAASAVWMIDQNAWMDYALDGSGELGGRIAKNHNDASLAAVRAHGFTPASYNQALRDRLAPDYPRMSRRVFNLLGVLEVEDEDEFHDSHTTVCTLGYPGHPGAEFSTIAYLKGA